MFVAAEDRLLCQVVEECFIPATHMLLAAYYEFDTKYLPATMMTYTAVEVILIIIERASSKVGSSVASIFSNLKLK
jgi:hypothetical protein